ncbi:MAG: Zn-ribbon containing protein [Candidatus Nanoarchaeia archaeon]|nr:Zn-ribbon containing protein [Candidatus Nanoarchaeia archaeon]MDD5054233.1 Zn-ribbon containing protein [Candidatus Nanoarchaeia archaeon]MDD5499270.1 Zn-ribbon containing protein [Candidatus Nanoarchaeia archaeon]
MPHQCVKCGKIYGDASNELLTGCGECKGKFFFFIKKEKMKTDFIEKLSNKDIEKIEKDIRELIPELKSAEPIILDLETIRVIGPGKYEIDVGSLMRGKPVIIQVGDGKYFIDLPNAFKK